MRAISRFIPEVGISTVSCSAWLALRIRVSMSPIGSVVIVLSPARLRHAGDHALVRELAQTDTADPKFAEVGARAPAPVASVVRTRRVLRLPRLFDSECFLRHCLRLTHERHPERTEELARSLVVGCGGGDGDVQ